MPLFLISVPNKINPVIFQEIIHIMQLQFNESQNTLKSILLPWCNSHISARGQVPYAFFTRGGSRSATATGALLHTGLGSAHAGNDALYAGQQGTRAVLRKRHQGTPGIHRATSAFPCQPLKRPTGSPAKRANCCSCRIRSTLPSWQRHGGG